MTLKSKIWNTVKYLPVGSAVNYKLICNKKNSTPSTLKTMAHQGYILLPIFLAGLWVYASLFSKELNPLKQPATIMKVEAEMKANTIKFKTLYEKVLGNEEDLTPKKDLDFWMRAGYKNELDKDKNNIVSLKEYLEFHKPHQRFPRLKDLENAIKSYEQSKNENRN